MIKEFQSFWKSLRKDTLDDVINDYTREINHLTLYVLPTLSWREANKTLEQIQHLKDKRAALQKKKGRVEEKMREEKMTKAIVFSVEEKSGLFYVIENTMGRKNIVNSFRTKLEADNLAKQLNESVDEGLNAKSVEKTLFGSITEQRLISLAQKFKERGYDRKKAFDELRSVFIHPEAADPKVLEEILDVVGFTKSCEEEKSVSEKDATKVLAMILSGEFGEDSQWLRRADEHMKKQGFSDEQRHAVVDAARDKMQDYSKSKGSDEYWKGFRSISQLTKEDAEAKIQYWKSGGGPDMNQEHNKDYILGMVEALKAGNFKKESSTIKRPKR